MSQDLALLTALLMGTGPRRFDVRSFCFPKQLAFIQDPADVVTAVCSRRAGKSTGCAAHILCRAKGKRRINVGYITLSKISAKRIIWPELRRQNQTFALGGKFNNTELSVSFPNESNIFIFGAHQREEIEKIRGIPFDLVYIDEVQSMRPFVRDLVEDVLEASLFDYGGKLRLIGTPGPVPTGYFYDMANAQGVSHHHWTIFDNPHIKKKSGRDPMDRLKEVLKRRGVTLQHPSIRREFFGEWMADPDALVFKYDAERNHFDQLPEFKTPWRYVIGVDLGYDDSDAISLIGWNPESPTAYLVFEDVCPKQGISKLFQKLDSLLKLYRPMSMVMDTGGLGKKIAEEMRKRTKVPVKAAEKIRKLENIEILNDALRTGRFMASKNSQFAQDCALIEWDRDHTDRDRANDKLKISERFHSDAADSVLYSYREAMHWLHVPAVIQPKRGSPEWFKQEEEKLKEEFRRQVQNQYQKEDDLFADLRS